MTSASGCHPFYFPDRRVRGNSPLGPVRSRDPVLSWINALTADPPDAALSGRGRGTMAAFFGGPFRGLFRKNDISIVAI